MTGRTYRRHFLLLGGVCLLLLLGSMLVGRYGLSVDKLLHMLWTRLTGGAADWSVSDEKVVFAIRLPRIAAAALVGAALAVSGTAYQGMFRNPMVSPDILGASTGAGFGAALAILLGAGYFGISLSAFCFGLLAVAAAWLVSRLSRSDPTVALILAGMMISSLFSAGTSFIKLVADTQQQLPAITYWLMGSLSSIKAEDVRFLVLPVAVGLLPLFLLRWRMNLLTVGGGGGSVHGRADRGVASGGDPVRHAADHRQCGGVRHDRLGGSGDPPLLSYAVRLRLPAADPGGGPVWSGFPAGGG